MKNTTKHPGGRPPMFKTAKELQVKIDDYFRDCPDTVSKFTKDGDEIIIPHPTITGLVLHCGFCNRASFYDMEKIPEFTHTIKRARTRIENEYEKHLFDGGAGAIFALKNFGWIDRQEIDHGIKTDTDTQALKDLYNEISGKTNGVPPEAN